MMDDLPESRTERLLSLNVPLRAYAFQGLIEAGIAMGEGFLYLYGPSPRLVQRSLGFWSV